MAKTNSKSQAGQPGRVLFLDGQNEFPMLEVSTAWSTAEIYLHGAHVTNFKKKDEPPLLFMSQCSRFAEGQPIRGGIPVIFPWFGMREGLGMHGYARVKEWSVKEFSPAPDGSVSIRFQLPDCPESSTLPPFKAEYVVTVDQALTLELIVTNESKEDTLTFENCLHTYFEIGDITAVSVHGLKGVKYLDKTANFAERLEAGDAIRVSSEVDRVYMNTTALVEIRDARFGRKILVEKQCSDSTVVWNPWVAKSQQMPDFGNDEYQRMICVESGNVGASQISLAPGKKHVLTVKLSSEGLG